MNRITRARPSVRGAVRAESGDGRFAGDEGVAIMTALMLIMVLAAVSVLMLGVVVAQVKPTMFGTKNTRTVFAAEAGVDAALSQVRSALGAPDILTGDVLGDPRLLPCSVQGPVGGTGTTLTYQVQMQYFDEDPETRDDTWRAANAFPCTVGSGVTTPPSFAVLRAEGLDAGVAGFATDAGDRLLETIYTFQVENDNIDGGNIYSFGAGWCLQAEGQSIGSTVRYVPADECRVDDPRRLWSWKKDYAIHLAITDLAGAATKLCLTGDPAGGNGNATLQPCTAGNTNQMFSWEGGARWRGQNTTNTNYSSYCLSAGEDYTDLTDRKLKYGWCGGGDSLSGSFDPDPRVGAGAAGYSTVQIVNFLEFGRCMDVTNENVNYDRMIVYPCKQDPSGGSKLKWNHKWYYTEPVDKAGQLGPQQIYVKRLNSNAAGDKYCLTTPGTGANPAFVTMKVCNGGANQNWTRTAQAETYADSWTFTDQYGRCAALGPKWNNAWSTITAVPCNGGPEQKWNAPPLSQDAKLDDYRELDN